jgi:SAM-dependent methyltransferase
VARVETPGRPHADSQSRELHYWEHSGGVAHFDLHLRYYQRVFPFTAVPFNSARVLDVGAGAVSVWERMAPASASIVPFDPLADDFNRIAPDKKFPIRSELPAGPFDLISIFNCLDHMDAPSELLAALRPRLAPGGRLWIYVHIDRPFDPDEHPQLFRFWHPARLVSEHFRIERCGLSRETLVYPYAWWGICSPKRGGAVAAGLRTAAWTVVCGAYYARFHATRAAIKALKLLGLRRLLPPPYRF